MRMSHAIAWFVIASCCTIFAKDKKPQDQPPAQAELDATTARGRMMMEYDIAAWHATDVVQDMKPEQGAFRYYIAKKEDAGWVVAFGRLNETRDKFLIVYEATQGTRPDFFTAKRYEPPLEDKGFYLFAARAFDGALKDFQAEKRPYNTYAIPTGDGQLFAYILPAQVDDHVFPLGGDVRYTFAVDGSAMLAKRQMHKSILEFKVDTKMVAGTHTHVLTLSPEDSDVFHVLTRRPSVPEYVATLDKHLYVIQTDGTIKRVK